MATADTVQSNPAHPYGFGPAPMFEKIPNELRGGLWCVWYATPKEGKPGKFEKIPSNGDHNISTVKPEQWLPFDQARAIYESSPERFNGVGRLVRPEDGLIYGDIDGIDAGTEGQWAEWSETYTELSPSGGGIRIIGYGTTTRDITKPIEVYSGHGERFVTVTGAAVNGTTMTDITDKMEQDFISKAPEPAAVSDASQPALLDPDGLPEVAPITIDSVEGERSEEFAKKLGALYSQVPDMQQLFTLAWEMPDVQDYLLSKRRNDEGRALSLLWGEVKRVAAYKDEKQAKAREMMAAAQAAITPAVGESLPRFVYIYDIHKFMDTRAGYLNSVEKMDKILPTGPKQPPMTTLFFVDEKQPGVNYFSRLTYMPGVATGAYNGDQFNIWKPPANINPRAGDISLWTSLMDHLFPDPDIRNHIIRFMAYTLQRQDVKINHALLIIGDIQGAGKDSAFAPLLHGIGKDNHTMVFPKELHGNFNDFLKGTKLLVVQEVMDFSQGEMEHYLKPLLASPPEEIAINEKNIPRYKLPNIWNTVMFSNEPNAAKVSKGDRRYFVARTDADVWPHIEALWDWYKNWDGLDRVLGYLLTLDVSDFKPYAPPPMTAAKADLIDLSRTAVDVQVHAEIEAAPVRWQVFEVRMLEIQMNGKHNTKQITLALARLGYHPKQIKVDGRRVRMWIAGGLKAKQPQELADIYKAGLSAQISGTA